MIQRKFGWTGDAVPVIGQGTWNIEGNQEMELRSIAALKEGLDLGMGLIDTAEMYGSGRAEILTGRAITGRRPRVFLVSKLLPSNATFEGTLRACEGSLQRLRTDRLDLYLLHWESRHPIGETMRAMETLVARGMVRFIGVSNFDVPLLKAAQEALRNERLACNQVLYHLGDRGIERKLIPYCAEQEIAVMAYSPFGQQAFPAPNSTAGRALAEIAQRNGRTPRQVALNFLTRHENVFAIPKSSSLEHTRENSGGAGWPLGPEDLAQMERAFPAPDRDVPLGMI